MAFNQKILLLSGEYDHGHFKAINRLSVIGFTWIPLNVNLKCKLCKVGLAMIVQTLLSIDMQFWVVHGSLNPD